MTKADKYVRLNLPDELKEVQNSPIANVNNGLTIYEKTLVYHYTKHGYEALNQVLRASPKKRPVLAQLLKNVLAKLPNHKGVVHRTIQLTKGQIQQYKNIADRNGVWKAPAFISASKSSLIARLRPKFNVKFQIVCRSGKAIEAISYLGAHEAVNEEEVLFPPGTAFKVLDVTNMGDFMLIKLEEK